MGDIYKEAVDDVKAMKLAAEESAKNLLVEAMTPRLKNQIQSLFNEADEHEDEGDASQNGASEDADVDGSSDEFDSEDGDADDVELEEFEDSEDEDCDDDDEDVNEGSDSDDDEDEDEDDDSEDEDDEEMDESVEITQDDLRKAFAEVVQNGLKEEKGVSGKFKDQQDPNDGEYGLAHKIEGEMYWDDAKKVLAKAKKAKQVTKENFVKLAQVYAKSQRELKETLKAYAYLKKNLHEMNLFNAKLVYSTRLMQNNLSPKQQKSVMESFEKATTKQEVELLYQALSENFKIAGLVKEGRTKVKGPKASRFVKPGATLNEGKEQMDSETARWAELAGLAE